MAKLIENFTLKSGKEVSVYDLGNYSYEFLIKNDGNEDHRFTYQGAQSGVSAGNTIGEDNVRFTEDENEAIAQFSQLQSQKGF